jgi:hypothetical protein
MYRVLVTLGIFLDQSMPYVTINLCWIVTLDQVITHSNKTYKHFD